jgi:5-formyltetrahydrofolate cyclo-ligase
MDITQYKDEIRKDIKCKRKSLSSDDVIKKSDVICSKILSMSQFKQSKCIYCYYPVNNEVNIIKIINQALRFKKTVALPKVIDKAGTMIFCPVSGINDLSTGYYNIPEPATDIQAPEADLILVPGVAFSLSGKRIGQAGGFYDRFLSQHNIYSVGVAYDFQIFDDLPVLPHDIYMNTVVSDKIKC